MQSINQTNIIFFFFLPGNLNATLIMKEIAGLLKSINATQLVSGGDIGTDVAPWISAGVPGASLVNENNKYFYFHHTNGKSILEILEPCPVKREACCICKKYRPRSACAEWAG